MAKSISDLSEKMKDMDFCTMTTVTEDGELSGRPMSNNREVDYEGDSWFFADGDSRLVSDIENRPDVSLSFQGKAGLLGLRPLFIIVEGAGQIVRDRETFAKHWHKELERWWPEGVETVGLTLVKVRASRLHYWDGDDQGDVSI
jgi:general stress protein 26